MRLQKYLLHQGLFRFSKGFWSGFKSGAISGGISGGINGYQHEKEAGVSPWTGYKIVGKSRPYSTSFAGNPGNFVMKDKSKFCYAEAAAYSNPKDPNPQNYIDAMGGANGASMYDLARSNKYNAESGMQGFSDIPDYDQLGGLYSRDYRIYSTPDNHAVVIMQFTVSDKMNLFFGGTHQIISDVLMMDPLVGGLTNGANYMSSQSIMTWIKW